VRRNPFVNQVFVVPARRHNIWPGTACRNPFVNQVFVVSPESPPNGYFSASQSLRKSGLCRRGAPGSLAGGGGRRNPFVNQVFVVEPWRAKNMRHIEVAIPS